MKAIKYILCFIIVLIAVYACTSDGENKTVRYSGSDLSGLTMYAGSDNGMIEVKIGGDSVANIDSLKRVLVTKHFGSLFTNDRNRFDGSNISYEFYNGKVTYINRNKEDSVNLLVSEYEFRNDTLWINMDVDGKKQLFAGLGTSPDDIHYNSGFAHFKGVYQGKDTTMLFMTRDTLITDEVLSKRFGFATDLSNMTVKDTIVWCNVNYLFSR